MTRPLKRIREKDVLLSLRVQTWQEAVRSSVATLSDHSGMIACGKVTADLLSAPNQLGTFVAPGIWLPHLRTDSVRGILIGAATFAQRWQHPSAAEPIKVMFLILAQNGLVNEYLAVVGELARVLSEPGTTGALGAAESAEQFMELLSQ